MRKHLLLFLLGTVMIISVSVPSALAYFSTYVRVRGTAAVSLYDETELDEPDVTNMTKHVVITAKENSDPVYVRVRAYAPTAVEEKLVYTGTGDWTKGTDGWYYYNTPIKGNETAEMDVTLTNLPENAHEEDTFNVVVVYECIPAKYNSSNQPYADWSDTNLIITTEDGGTQG